MYRIDDRFEPPMDIRTLADECHITLVYAVSRCEHGYTRDQMCVSCENGYAHDHHTFARLRSRPIYAKVGDDGTYVAYIPQRFASKLRAYGYYEEVASASLIPFFVHN